MLAVLDEELFHNNYISRIFVIVWLIVTVVHQQQQAMSWSLVLSEHELFVKYRRGRLNVVADAMSRFSAFCSQMMDQIEYGAIKEG